MQLTTTKRNTKKGRRAPQKILTRPFSHIPENSPHFFLHFNLETCINASSPKARRGVSSLSLILLFYCYYCAWCKDIYRERRTGKFGTDERNRSDRSFIFLLKRFAFAKYLLFIARKETNDDGFHVGQR